MANLFRRCFPFHRFNYANKAIKVLTITDSVFYSGIALVEVVFSVFVVSKIPGATLINLGIGHALFQFGIIISEPVFLKFFDSKSILTSFYGMLLGNLLKTLSRIAFIFLFTVNQFYLVYFLLGIVHSFEYPAFFKLFTTHVDKGYESSDWGFKDIFLSVGNVVASFASGYIALLFGYNYLFILAAMVMFIFGVVLPFVYRKELVK